MGPLTLNQLLEKLAPQHPERKMAELEQLWRSFGIRWAFLDSAGANTFAATVVGETGVGTLKETTGLLTLQLTPFREITGVGCRERAENVQLYLAVGDKEHHLAWPGGLSAMLEDEAFNWIVNNLAGRFSNR